MSLKKKNEPLHFSKADTLSYLISQIKYINFAMSARTPKNRNSYEWLLQVKSPNYIYMTSIKNLKKKQNSNRNVQYILYLFFVIIS